MNRNDDVGSKIAANLGRLVFSHAHFLRNQGRVAKQEGFGSLSSADV